jgi:pyridoxamine 5'-phosphate oxidase
MGADDTDTQGEALIREAASELPPFYDDLDGTLRFAWAMLARGVKDRRAPAHTPALATVDASGRPQMRTVVLRGCEPAVRRLRFHTDIRAAKVSEIAANPRGSVMVYDARQKFQLRLSAMLSVHTHDALASAAWAQTRDFSKICYQVMPAPGTRVDEPAAIPFSAQATNDGADHFAVIIAQIERIEWLYLAHQGHRRAAFEWLADVDGGCWNSSWLVP